MRVWFDRAKGRWVVQEKGRLTGRWQYVMLSQAPDGSPREPGNWLLARLHAADMTVVQAGAQGARKLKAMDDGVRKQRMMQKAIAEAERFGFEFLPRALDKLGRHGFHIPKGKLTAEERIRDLRLAGVRGPELEAAMGAEQGFTTGARKVFEVHKPSKQECKQALRAWNAPKKRRKC